METLEGRVTRHARIDAIKARVQQALKRSIDKQEALAPEKLGLDLEESKVTKNKPQRDNAKYWAKAESKRTKQENHVSSHFQTIPRQDDPAQRTWCPPAAPSYQPLPIPALRSDQHVLSSQPRQTFDPYAYRSPAPLVRYQPSQGFNPIKGSSRAAIHPIAQFVPITIPLRDTASAFENKSGPGPTVQKSSMSVSTYRRIPPPRIDKYSRYSKAHDPPDPKQVQLGRWTGSPATKVQQFVPATSKPLKSTHVKGMETSAPQIKTKATHWKKSNDIPLIYLPAPVPTPAYLTMAHATATVLTSPQRLLLVLDLNGTLLYRPKTSQNYTPRPSLEAFLNYAFTNHSILIWSSATPYNVTSICARLFNAKRRQLLLGEWGRDTLGLTAAQYKERVQVYKRLDTSTLCFRSSFVPMCTVSWVVRRVPGAICS